MKKQSRRAFVRGSTASVVGAALAAASVPSEGGAAAPSPIITAARRWHELQTEITNLRRRRDVIGETLSAEFDDLGNIDPRGDWGDPSVSPALVQRIERYRMVFASSGLQDIHDRLTVLREEQDPLTERLRDASPATATDALILAGVWLTYARDDFLGDECWEEDEWRVSLMTAGLRIVGEGRSLTGGVI